jgi:hypothetical protein
MKLYTRAESIVQINGHMSSPFRVQCGVRQGCPLSMHLFELCLDTLINLLTTRLRFHRRFQRTAVVAYADDVIIFVQTPDDIPALEEAILTYAKATGAVLNVNKSKALAIGGWDERLRIMGIPYCADLRILGLL